jgi:tripartite-type tricarboxylate transporter receptor subunit TctC
MRRRSLVMAGSAGLLATQAFAQAYPTRPVRIIAPFGAGGGGDALGRLVAQHLSQAFGQPFVVENRAGGNGVIGAQEVLRAGPDGHTLFLATTTTNAINASLVRNLPYDPVRDFTMIGQLTRVPYILVTSREVPAMNLQDLVALARQRPGALSYASGSTPAIVAGALLGQMAGVQLLHVPYRTTVAALTDVVAGRVSMMFSDFAPALAQIRGGRVNAIAVTSATRSLLVPDLPSMAEAGVPGFEIIGWVALGAPAGLPGEIVTLLNAALHRILALAEVRDTLVGFGLEPVPSTAEAMSALVASDTTKWATLTRAAGIQAE